MTAGALPVRVPAEGPRTSARADCRRACRSWKSARAQARSRCHSPRALGSHGAGLFAGDARRAASKLASDPALRTITPVLARWEDADVSRTTWCWWPTRSIGRGPEGGPDQTGALRASAASWCGAWAAMHGGPQWLPAADGIHLVDGLFALDVFANVEIVERVAVIWGRGRRREAQPGHPRRRQDGNVPRRQGHLFVCATGCCCGTPNAAMRPYPSTCTTASGSGASGATACT